MSCAISVLGNFPLLGLGLWAWRWRSTHSCSSASSTRSSPTSTTFWEAYDLAVSGASGHVDHEPIFGPSSVFHFGGNKSTSFFPPQGRDSPLAPSPVQHRVLLGIAWGGAGTDGFGTHYLYNVVNWAQPQSSETLSSWWRQGGGRI